MSDRQTAINIDVAGTGAQKLHKPPLTPQEISQRQAGKDGAALMKWLLWAPAICFAAVSFRFIGLFAIDLATTLSEALTMFALAAAYTGLIAGLPSFALLTESLAPGDVSTAMRVWRWAILVAAAGVGFYIVAIGPRHVAVVATRSAEQIRYELNNLGTADRQVWSTSDSCQAPSRRQAAACQALLARRETLRTELRQAEEGSGFSFSVRDWLPSNDNAGKLAAATGSDESTFRRLFTLLLSLGALGLSGLLFRWGMMGRAQSFRLATGEFALGASAPATLAAEPVAQSDGSGTWSEIEVLKDWVRCRLKPKQGGSISSTLGHQDYVKFCALNGVEPMSSVKFGVKMTAIAEGSKGAMGKTKISGIIHYTGNAMVTDLVAVPDVPMQRIRGPS